MVFKVVDVLFQIGGSLGLFLFGMKVMSDGIQQSAGSKLQGVLHFMTGNRLSAVVTGLSVTAIIQSSSVTTVMVVSFVNAGLLTLTQATGVIMGANIGTTVTAWIVSLIGLEFNISAMAIPAVGLGFLLSAIKWRRRDLGNIVMGFGILFLGLDFLTKSMPQIDENSLSFLKSFSGTGVKTELLGVLIGLVITLLLHSSSASTAIMITMAFNGYIDFYFGASMILGANIGTTVDAALASIGTKTVAKRAAMVHILFNVIGAVMAILLFEPLVWLVNISSGGEKAEITTRMAMFHTIFNVTTTIIFFPFVNQFAKLVSLIVKEKTIEPKEPVYKFSYISGVMRDAPELSIIRAEKEIRDMASLVFKMYSKLRGSLNGGLNESSVAALIKDLQSKEEYADQMREELTKFLMECTRRKLNIRSEHNVGLLLRIIADLEDMTDDCYSVSLLLERSVRKNQIFKQPEMEALSPYMGMVGEFLSFVGDHLGSKLSAEQTHYAKQIEEQIDLSRNNLRKLGQRRIEEGEDVKTELLFIDFVRRIERLGDYCYGISNALSSLEE
jgi:phosphate:Na+ symporter